MGEVRKTKYFGTDGFRGEFGRELTEKHAYIIGRFLAGDGEATGGLFKDNRAEGLCYGNRAEGLFNGNRAESLCCGEAAEGLFNDNRAEGLCGGGRARRQILIGRDTRISSPMLEAAVAFGIEAAGGEAYLAGVITTPGLAFAIKHGGFDGGVMITASHNPYGDNGIKLFDSAGRKLADELIFELEKFIDEGLENKISPESYPPCGKDYPEARVAYTDYLTDGNAGSLSGLRIGLDTANGAAYKIAPEVFGRLGAEVHQIGGEPDGVNINAGLGSTHPGALADFVLEKGLDLGFAFDGDGDRCISVNSKGEIIDGDGEMFILARAMKARGELKNNTAVITVMSNRGFINSLLALGIGCEIVRVGDRFVAEKMLEGGYTLGGEQSGHIIIGNAETGDGIFTAISLAREIRSALDGGEGPRLGEGEMLSGLTLYPQISDSARVISKEALMADMGLISLRCEIEADIGDEGRILIRPSGTENLIRVMVEHKNPDKCKLYLEKTLNFIKNWKAHNER